MNCRHRTGLLGLTLLSGLLASIPSAGASGDRAAAEVRFEQSASQVDAYDFVEVAVRVARPTAKNPFRDVTVSGQFRREGGPPAQVEGFCDAPDGSLHRVRFMPSRPGRYTYTVEYRE